jgi:hypothetical protein
MSRTVTDPRQMTLALAMPRGRPRQAAPRYRAFLVFVRAHVRQTGRAPSYGAVCGALGLSDRSNVRRLVIMGERRGHMARTACGLMLV